MSWRYLQFHFQQSCCSLCVQTVHRIVLCIIYLLINNLICLTLVCVWYYIWCDTEADFTNHSLFTMAKIHMHHIGRVGPICVCHTRCSVETDGRIYLVLAWRLLSTCHTLHFKELRVSTKIRVLPCGTLS